MDKLKKIIGSFFEERVPKKIGIDKEIRKDEDEIYFRHEGYCPICECDVVFESVSSWFRDNLRCSECQSIPRERALIRVLKNVHPDFRELKIHESSPGGRGATQKMKNECEHYSYSYFFPNVTFGELDPETGFRCENLEALTFPDNTFDLFITQDVFEHVMNPLVAFREIGRVLKPGGSHIFTAPLVNKFKPSERRASLLDSGEVHYLKDPIYHGNPVNRLDGSLVTVDWGYDIASYILNASGLSTMLIQIDDIDMGIRADLIEVVVCKKVETSTL